MANRLLVGAHVVVYLNNSPFGRVADLAWSVSTPKKQLHCVDWLSPVELIPTSREVQASMTIFKMHGDGGIEAAGLAGAWGDSTMEKYFSILVIDKLSDTTIFRSDRCSVVSQSWKVGRGYVMGSISFTGLHWSNDAGERNPQ